MKNLAPLKKLYFCIVNHSVSFLNGQKSKKLWILNVNGLQMNYQKSNELSVRRANIQPKCIRTEKTIFENVNIVEILMPKWFVPTK